MSFKVLSFVIHAEVAHVIVCFLMRRIIRFFTRFYIIIADLVITTSNLHRMLLQATLLKIFKGNVDRNKF